MASNRPTYPREVYKCEIRRVVDGDTLDIVPAEPTRLRLLGFDAAETRGASDKEEALAAGQTVWVLQWLADRRIVVDGRGYDNFGRQLAWIFDADTGECLNLAFVRRWPDRARNPRKQMQRLGIYVHSREQCKP